MDSLARAKGMDMNTAPAGSNGFQEILERKEAELAGISRIRDDIAIEKSADQMDEIQYASERDLAIRNVDRESTLLREVKAALRRIHEGSFGTCIECEWAISPRRLAAVPWAPRCITCQDAADRGGRESTESVPETRVYAAGMSGSASGPSLTIDAKSNARACDSKAREKSGSSSENRAQLPNHRVSRQLPTAQMRHRHVHV